MPFRHVNSVELVSKQEVEYNDLVDILDDNENTNVLKAKFSKDKLGEGSFFPWQGYQYFNLLVT